MCRMGFFILVSYNFRFSSVFEKKNSDSATKCSYSGHSSAGIYHLVNALATYFGKCSFTVQVSIWFCHRVMALEPVAEHAPAVLAI